MKPSTAIAWTGAAAIAAAVALTSPVLARGGIGGGGGGGMGHSGGMGGMGHVSMGGTGGMGGMSHAGMGFAGVSHVGAWHPGGFNRFDGHHRVFFRHRFLFAPGFAYVGAPYAYDDSCYQRVWTRWGWRLVDVCY
jgi:hypothetical protein